MDNNVLFDVRFAVMCSMLFMTVVSVTAEEPAAVPGIFQRMWHRYQLFREMRKIRASGASTEKFWEIDMTKFEP
jgi:hypothetical protein